MWYSRKKTIRGTRGGRKGIWLEILKRKGRHRPLDEENWFGGLKHGLLLSSKMKMVVSKAYLARLGDMKLAKVDGKRYESGKTYVAFHPL